MNKIFERREFSIVECDDYYLIIPKKKEIRAIFKEMITNSSTILFHKLIIDKEPMDCSYCKNHNYDWDIDDGYGGDEYEVCDKGHDLYPMKCKDFEEL